MKYVIVQSVHREYLLALRTKKTREKAKKFIEAPKICKKKQNISTCCVVLAQLQYQEFRVFPPLARAHSSNLKIAFGQSFRPRGSSSSSTSSSSWWPCFGQTGRGRGVRGGYLANSIMQPKQHFSWMSSTSKLFIVKPVVKGGKLLKTIQIARKLLSCVFFVRHEWSRQRYLIWGLPSHLFQTGRCWGLLVVLGVLGYEPERSGDPKQNIARINSFVI